MNIRQALYQMWDNDPNTLRIHSGALAQRVRAQTGKLPSQKTVNLYRCYYKNDPERKEELTQEQQAAGKKLRCNEQKRRWKIEEACNALIEEQASLQEMQAAGLQFVVLKTAA